MCVCVLSGDGTTLTADGGGGARQLALSCPGGSWA